MVKTRLLVPTPVAPPRQNGVQLVSNFDRSGWSALPTDFSSFSFDLRSASTYRWAGDDWFHSLSRYSPFPGSTSSRPPPALSLTGDLTTVDTSHEFTIPNAHGTHNQFDESPTAGGCSLPPTQSMPSLPHPQSTTYAPPSNATSSQAQLVRQRPQATLAPPVSSSNISPHSSDLPSAETIREDRPRRPRNKWIIFRCEFIKNNPGAKEGCPPNASTAAARAWKALSPQERVPYEQEAKREADVFKKKYPDYKYRPRRKAKKVTEKSEDGRLDGKKEQKKRVASIRSTYLNLPGSSTRSSLVGGAADRLKHRAPSMANSEWSMSPTVEAFPRSLGNNERNNAMSYNVPISPSIVSSFTPLPGQLFRSRSAVTPSASTRHEERVRAGNMLFQTFDTQTPHIHISSPALQTPVPTFTYNYNNDLLPTQRMRECAYQPVNQTSSGPFLLAGNSQPFLRGAVQGEAIAAQGHRPSSASGSHYRPFNEGGFQVSVNRYEGSSVDSQSSNLVRAMLEENFDNTEERSNFTQFMNSPEN